MLEFFRRHQTYFFAFITAIIVISFSFFGTFNTMNPNPAHDQVAFKAIDGKEITRRELDEMVYFISTDSEDKLLHGGAWGPNFLNDGVIAKDFFQSGLATLLVQSYPEAIVTDLSTRSKKEHSYSLYAHPQAKFVGVETVWTYFAPEMKQSYDLLQKTEHPESDEAFKARVSLYLKERKLPAPMLRQLLRYQQKQFPWLKPDLSLDRADLSLFGYHTAEDWFGPRFMRLVAEFIINASAVAEQKGYYISKEEVLADLFHNADVSYQQNSKNPQIGVANRNEYFSEQMLRLGMDQNRAIKVWRQVMLFRRLFQDIGNAIWIDPLSFAQFDTYANEQTIGDLYKLPRDFRLSNYRALQKFAIYLEGIAQKSNDPTALPETVLSVQEVAKSTPELVHKNYKLSVKQANKNQLALRVGIRQLWDWEADESNWDLLKKQFPELRNAPDSDQQQRTAALDQLEDAVRMRVDAFARKQIVESHPEWVEQALEQASAQEKEIGIRFIGGNAQFGLTDRRQLIQWLDLAPLKGEEKTDAASQDAARQLAFFTGDKETFFNIQVIERGSEKVMLFAEADKEGVLDALLDRTLERYFAKVRDTKPELFKNKEFAAAKEQVANLYFEPLLLALTKVYKKAYPDTKAKEPSGDLLATIRFYPYLTQVRSELEMGKDPSLFLQPQKVTLTDQWKIEKENITASRGTEKTRSEETRSEETQNELDLAKFVTAPIQQWSQVQPSVHGDLYFFIVKSRGEEERIADQKQLKSAHTEIAYAAQRNYMEKLLVEIKAKKAISLEFMETPSEESLAKNNKS